MGEIAPPEPNGVFPDAECFGNPRAGPAGKRQQYGAGSVRLTPITGTRKRRERRPLFVTRKYRGSPGHATLLGIGDRGDSQATSVGQPSGICLGQ